MANEITAAIIAVLGTLAGAGVGGLISSKAADRIATRQAYARLTAAFAEDLAILKTSTETEVGSAYEILRASHKKHLTAYIELRAVLRGDARKSIEHRWATYTQEEQDFHPTEREMYRFSYLLQQGQPEADMCLLAIKHIESLIQCE